MSGKEIGINIDFMSPSFGAIKNEIDCYFHFCIDHKLAFRTQDGKIEDVFKISVRNDKLYINYNRNEGFEQVGSIAQSKFENYLVEKALISAS